MVKVQGKGYKYEAFGLITYSTALSEAWSNLTADNWANLGTGDWGTLPISAPPTHLTGFGQNLVYHDPEIDLYMLGLGGRGRFLKPGERFLSADPIRKAEAGDNEFVYADNNPITNRDPSGQDVNSNLGLFPTSPEQMQALAAMAQAQRQPPSSTSASRTSLIAAAAAAGTLADSTPAPAAASSPAAIPSPPPDDITTDYQSEMGAAQRADPNVPFKPWSKYFFLWTTLHAIFVDAPVMTSRGIRSGYGQAEDQLHRDLANTSADKTGQIAALRAEQAFTYGGEAISYGSYVYSQLYALNPIGKLPFIKPMLPYLASAAAVGEGMHILTTPRKQLRVEDFIDFAAATGAAWHVASPAFRARKPSGNPLFDELFAAGDRSRHGPNTYWRVTSPKWGKSEIVPGGNP